MSAFQSKSYAENAKMSVFPELNPKSSIGDVLFANPQRFNPILEFTHGVMRGDGAFSVPNRELLAGFVSALNECSFCHGVHAATARKFGVAPDLLDDLIKDIESADVAASLKPVFRFAKKLTLEPSKIVDLDREQVRDAGHSTDTLKGIIAIVALFGLFNRLLDGHGVAGDAEIFSRDSEILHTYGYAGPPA